MPGLPQGLRTLTRAAWGLTGVLWFLWLGVEDRSADGPVMVAAAACLALGLSTLQRCRGVVRTPGYRRLDTVLGHRVDGRIVWLAQCVVCGFGAGLAVGPLAALLMLVKVSLHDHPAPDFTAADLGATLMRTPAWALAGLCLGAALGLAGMALTRAANRDDAAARVESPPGEEW